MQLKIFHTCVWYFLYLCMIFPIIVYDFSHTSECMENFQAQTKNLYMCIGHLKVWKKSHTFVWDIYDWFLQCVYWTLLPSLPFFIFFLVLFLFVFPFCMILLFISFTFLIFFIISNLFVFFILFTFWTFLTFFTLSNSSSHLLIFVLTTTISKNTSQAFKLQYIPLKRISDWRLKSKIIKFFLISLFLVSMFIHNRISYLDFRYLLEHIFFFLTK